MVLVALINASRKVRGPLSCLHLLSGMGPVTMRIKNAGEMKLKEVWSPIFVSVVDKRNLIMVIYFGFPMLP